MNNVNELRNALTTRNSASGALRREIVSAIQQLVKELLPVLPLLAVPIDHQRRYVAGHGWRFEQSTTRAFCAYSDSTCEGHSRPHSWTGTEIWIGEDGVLWEVTLDGWYAGLGHAGDVVEEEARVMTRIGAREIARKHGIAFVDSLCKRIAEATVCATSDANKMALEIGKLRRLQLVLTREMTS